MNQDEPIFAPDDPVQARRASMEEVGPLPTDELAVARDEIGRLAEALAAANSREVALIHELHNRVRNLLSVIRSLHRRSWESGASQEEFAQHFEGRLGAVARYYSHVDPIGAGIDLEDAVRNELLKAGHVDGPDCVIEGPPVRLRQKSAEMMGLAIHELATNSIKFGAIIKGGHLAVTWSFEDDHGTERLRFQWTETGVPVASAAPRLSGFGRQFIEEALPYQLSAVTSFELRPGGVECVILLPQPSAPEADLSDLRADDPGFLPSDTK